MKKEQARRNGQKIRAVRTSSHEAPPLEVFEKLLLQNNIATRGEYFRWFRTARGKALARPYKLPRNADRFYPGFSWKEHAAKAAAAKAGAVL